MWTGRLFKLKNKKVATWRAWCESLMTAHKEDALASLVEEHVTQEMWVTFQLNGNWYTLGCGHELDKAGAVNPNRAVNKIHKAMKEECFEGPAADIEVDTALRVV